MHEPALDVSSKVLGIASLSTSPPHKWRERAGRQTRSTSDTRQAGHSLSRAPGAGNNWAEAGTLPRHPPAAHRQLPAMRGAQRLLLRSLLQPGPAGQALATAGQAAAASGGEVAACGRSLARAVAAASARGFAFSAQQAWRAGVGRPAAASLAAAHVSEADMGRGRCRCTLQLCTHAVPPRSRTPAAAPASCPCMLDPRSSCPPTTSPAAAAAARSAAAVWVCGQRRAARRPHAGGGGGGPHGGGRGGAPPRRHGRLQPAARRGAPP